MACHVFILALLALVSVGVEGGSVTIDVYWNKSNEM